LKDVLRVPAAGEVQPRIQAALDALTSGSVSAQDYMLAATLLPMFEKGIVGRHEDSLHWSRAAMVEQAIQQRNAQWAAEQTLFTRIVRPMLTWIEGFSYAVTPLMAFAVMLGARGIQISGQYFLMLLWIQLWMPILAVVNLYITLSAGGALSALNAAQFHLPSLAGLYRMDMELQNWLAVGGMLAASTPAIALMLVYGGSITATHFLGRMQGGDFVDEKITTPPVVSPAPLLNLQATHQHGPLTGTALSGAERVLPTFQAGQDLSATVSSARTALQQASRGFMESLSNQASHSVGLSQEGFESHSLGQRISSSHSETDRFLKATGEDFSHRYRDSGVSSDDFAALVGGAASGMFQRGPANRRDRDRPGSDSTAEGEWETTGRLQAGLSGQLQNRFHVEKSRADEIASDIAQRVTTDQGWQTDLARSLATDVQSGTREVASLGLQRQDLSSLQKTAQDTVSAAETFQETASAQQRFGTAASFGALETGQRIAGSPANLALLENTLDRFGLRGDAQRLGAEWRAIGLINDKDQAYAAAGMALLTGHASPVFRPLEPQEARQAQTAGYGILGEVFHAPRPNEALQPDRHAGLRAEAPAPGEVRSKVEAEPFQDPREETQNLDGQTRERMEQTSGRVDQGESQVTAAHEASRSHVNAQSDDGVQAMHADKAAYFREEIRKAANSDGSPAELEYDVVGGGIYDAAQKLSSLGSATLDGFVNAFEVARSHGKSIGDSLIEAVRSAPDDASKAYNLWVNEHLARTDGKLTQGQSNYYRAALLESFAGIPLTGDYNQHLGDMSKAKENLFNEEPESAEDISELLRRAAGQNRPDLVDLIGQYNAARSSGDSSLR
jgi:conjugal transfer mating pair stabilization protein TraG